MLSLTLQASSPMPRGCFARERPWPRPRPRRCKCSHGPSVKQAEDAEATVAGYVPGKGKLHGLVGALLCIDRGSGQTFRIGTGLTEQERAHPPAVGAEVTYKFSERTAGGAPRFPVFVRERPQE